MNIVMMMLAMVQPAGTPVITNAVIAPPRVTPVARPIVMTPFVPGSIAGEAIVGRFVAGAATCDATIRQPLRRVEPLAAGYARYAAIGFPQTEPRPATLRFDLDASGRPTNIRAEGAGTSYPVDSRDVAPAFSLWRFAPRAARRDCRIRFDFRGGPVATADLGLLYEYLGLQRPTAPGFNPVVGRAALKRIEPAGANCRGEASPPVEQHHPAFATIPQDPGTAAFSFVSFDIAADGSTHNVALLRSGGNRELDRQSLAAIGKWRFPAGEARRGCIQSYVRRQEQPVPAPSPAPKESYAIAGARCRAEPAWTAPISPSYPEQFNRRAIEGWAVIGYDVAPWGATGNVRVLASEPAAEFGQQAAAAIRRATKPAGANGLSGCVQRVQFVAPSRRRRPPADVD